MCKTFIVSGQTSEGAWIDAENDFEFPLEAEEKALPTCTCHIGDDTPEGNAVWAAFCAHLRPLVKEIAYNRIIIGVV